MSQTITGKHMSHTASLILRVNADKTSIAVARCTLHFSYRPKQILWLNSFFLADYLYAKQINEEIISTIAKLVANWC